ncbi:MAG: hypothetical protein V4736_03630 [Bdellovibrionota bacterium]
MSSSGADQRYTDIKLLFEHGDPAEPLLSACYQAVTEFPTESRFWLLSSRILQKLEKPEEARKDINQALQFEPFNVDYNFQLFNVLVQQGETEMIPRRINWLFENGPQEIKIEIAGYALTAIESGLFSKLELVNAALSSIIRLKSSDQS